MRNVSKKTEVEKAKKKQQLIRENELIDIKEVMSTEYGRRFLYRLLGHCKVMRSVMTGNAWTSYNAGLQDVGHFIWGELEEADQKSLFLMLEEGKIAKERQRD